ncbi:hypothetical protein AB4876_12885 [Zhongshania guokunii]|uniref:Uncharacterized protein n=1 Tax=Zhongshania guokunii TaxID=641783 RepID=A0ABV3U9K9_9GAMM
MLNLIQHLQNTAPTLCRAAEIPDQVRYDVMLEPVWRNVRTRMTYSLNSPNPVMLNLIQRLQNTAPTLCRAAAIPDQVRYDVL